MAEKGHSVSAGSENGDFSQNGGTFADFIDLRRDGPIDQCTEMLAEKIMAPTFWTGAEGFLAQPAPLGGYELVRKALSRHIRRLLGECVPWDQLLLLPNASVALELFVRCCCSPGDVVLCPIPLAADEFPLGEFRSAHGTIDFVPVNLLWNSVHLSNVQLQQTIERLGKKRVRALLLHNPHPIFGWNGDGQRQLAHILEWATERDIFLLVDESLASTDLWEFVSCLGLDRRRLVWLWSAAKHFSLPGLEFAALLLPSADLRRLDLPLLRRHPCAPLVQYLVANLLEDLDWSSELFAKRKLRIEKLREKTIEGMAELGISGAIMGSAKPTTWILMDLKTFLDDIDFESERILREEFSQKAHLKLTSGEQLGLADPGWFRVRVESTEHKVSEVMQRLRMVLAGRRRGSFLEWERKDMRIYGGGGPGTAAEEKRTKRHREEEEQQQGGKEEELQTTAREKEEQSEKEREKKETAGKEETEEKETQEGNGEKKAPREKEEQPEKEREKKETEGEKGGMGDEEFLRQIFSFGEFQKTESSEEEEKDEIIQKVFSIFPKERLIWKGFAEEKSSKNQTEKRETIERREEKEVGEWAERGEGDTQKPNEAALWEKGDDAGGEKWQRAEAKGAVVSEAGKGMDDEYYDEVSTEEECAIGGQSQRHGEQRTEGEGQPKVGGSPTGHDAQLHPMLEQREYSPISDVFFVENIRRNHSVSDHHASDSDLDYHQQHQWPLTFSDSGMVGEQSPELFFGTPSDPIDIRPTGLIPDDTTRSRDSAFISDSSPTHTSTWIRKSDEWRSHGPTAQMMNDSGIFMDFLPGSLSIDFPLLVPTENLWRQNEEENDEGKQRTDGGGAFTVEMQFKTPKVLSEEEFRAIVSSADEGEREEEEGRENEPFEVAQWRPMEEIGPGPTQTKGGSEQSETSKTEAERNKTEDDPFRHEGDAQQKLASELNEGASFCPAKQQVTWVEVDGSDPGQIGGVGVPLWKPLEQYEEEEGKREHPGEETSPKLEPNAHSEGRKRSDEATDVVREWNTRVESKRGEAAAEEETRVDLHFVDAGQPKREATAEVRFGRDWTNGGGSAVRGAEEAAQSVQIPAHCESRENDIPARTPYRQIHQRMKMGRRLDDDDFRQSLPQDTIVVEHMNITQLEYGGGARRIQTHFSTQINTWAPDEWFTRIPTKEGLLEEGEWVGPPVRRDSRTEKATKAKNVWTGEIVGDADGAGTTNGAGRPQQKGPPQLHSEFESVHYGQTVESVVRTRHRYKWQRKRRQPKAPSRVTVTTTMGGAEDGDDSGPLSHGRVTVTHTPGSRWIVSSIYRSTDWGWEKIALPKAEQWK